MSINLKRVSQTLLRVASSNHMLKWLNNPQKHDINRRFHKYFQNLCLNSKYCDGFVQSKMSPVIYQSKFENSNPNKYNRPIHFITIAGIFSFFQTKEDEEESELIMTIKRAVLMIQVIHFIFIDLFYLIVL